MNNNDFDDENYLAEETNDNKDKMKTLKYIGFALIAILLIVVLIFLLKGCNLNKGDSINDLNKTLLEAGKEYYEYNEFELPKFKGECSTVDLKVLKDYELLNEKDFDECNEAETYVKVCMLESGKYHWVPILSCDSYKSEDHYLTWKEGKESDLIDGESDVRFLFQGKYLDLANASLGNIQELWKDEITLKNYKTLAVINYYSYRDKEYIWNLNEKKYYTSTGDVTKASDVNEYYTTSPKTGYTSKDSEDSTVAKWYRITTEGTPVYWNNGAYSITQPEGYSYYTGGIEDTRYSTRTYNKVGVPTTTSPTHMWECKSADLSNSMNLFSECGKDPLNPTFTVYVKDFYTCDNGLTTTTAGSTCYACSTGQVSADKTECRTYGTWSEFTKTACTGPIDICLSKTYTLYKWYKLEGEVRSYYPSGATTASGEKIYYKTAPISGATKDTSTTTTGYKWYKLVPGQSSGYSVYAPSENATKTDTFRWTNWTEYSTIKPSSNSGREIRTKQKIKLQEILSTTSEENWKNLTEDFVTEEEMIKKFNEIGKIVTNLSDINASGDLKYNIKIYLRNLNKEK